MALVAMATPEDMRIDAEHIRMADQFVEVSKPFMIKGLSTPQLIQFLSDKLLVSLAFALGRCSKLRAIWSEAEQRVLMCCLCGRRCREAPTTTTTAMFSSLYRWQTGPMWMPSGLDGMTLSQHCS